MRPIDYIFFDINNWSLLEVTRQEKRWMHKHARDVLSVTLFLERPDFASDLSDITTLRSQSAEAVAPLDGAVCEIGTTILDTIPTLRLILKLPQRTAGFGYIGTFTLPFQESSYVIKVQCAEQQLIGQREAHALKHLIQTGEVDLDLNSPDFSSESISPDIETKISTTSDSAQWDAVFPQHPLSRVRKYLDDIAQTIHLLDPLKQMNPFKYE